MRSNRLITALVLIAPPLTLALWSSLIVAGAMPNSPQAQGAPPSRKDYFLPPCPPLNKMETRRDHSAHAAMAKMVYSTVGLYRRPTTVRQFLSNLKIAADRRLVVQPQFAEERALRDFFNATEVSLTFDDLQGVGNQRKADFQISKQLFPRATAGILWTRLQYGVHGAARLEEAVTCPRSGGLSVTIEDAPTLTVGAVRQFFGNQVVEVMDTPLTTVTMDAPWAREFKGFLNYYGRNPKPVNGAQPKNTLSFFAPLPGMPPRRRNHADEHLDDQDRIATIYLNMEESQ